MRRTSTLLYPLCLAAIVAIAWAFRLVWAGQTGYGSGILNSWDLRLFFYPTYHAASRWIAEGKFPLWNPYQLCGTPWLATLQGGFFYPPHLLYLLLPTHIALAMSGLLHLLLIAFSTALLARRVGLTPAAAILAAVLFTLHGRVPTLLLWPAHLEAVAWLPLGCLAVLELARGTGTRAVALMGAIAGASFLAGYPYASVLLVYTWTTLLLVLAIGTRPVQGRRFVPAVLFAAALFLGALLSSVQMIPALELAQLSTRKSQMITAVLMAPGGAFHALGIIRETVTGPHPSFGILALSLAPAALFTRRPRMLALWAFGLAILTFLFALGPATPLFTLYRSLPALGWFRFPERILVISDFAMAILAAFGLDALRSRLALSDPAPGSSTDGCSPNRPNRGLMVTLALPVTCAIIIATRMMLLGSYQGLLIAAAIVTTLCVFAYPWRWRAQVVTGLLLVLGVIEVFLSPANQAKLPYDRETAAAYHAQGQVYTQVAEMAGLDRVWMIPSWESSQVRKLASYYRLRLIDDYDLSTQRQADYLIYFMEGTTRFPREGGYFSGWARLPRPTESGMTQATRSRLLDLAAVRFVIVGSERLTPHAHAFMQLAGFEPRPLSSTHLSLFENPNAVPRAFTVYRVRPAPPTEELLGLLARRDFDPLLESYVEGASGLPPPPTVQPRGEQATVVRDEERIVEIDAKLTAPGLVVLADSFYPGWRATVDGAPAPILPTNYLFRGVPVSAGRHLVRFEYRPWTLTAGGAASLLGLLVISVLLLRRGGGKLDSLQSGSSNQRPHV